jgi:hypothetical protein
MYQEKIIGVIYPLHRNIIERFLNEDKDIFIKYISRIRNKKSKFRLTPGLKLFLYESAFRKALVASATIKTIEFVNIEEIMDTYNDKLMISKNELVDYAKGRTKKIMILKLDNIIKLEPIIPVKCRITMSGRYITKDNLDEIFHINDLDNLILI